MFGDAFENLAWGIGRVSKLFGHDHERVQRKMHDLFNLPNSATNREKIEMVAKQIRQQIAKTTTLHYSFKDCVLFHWAYSKTPSEMFQLCLMIVIICIIHQGIKNRRLNSIRKYCAFKRAMAKRAQRFINALNVHYYDNYYGAANDVSFMYRQFTGEGAEVPSKYRRTMAIYYGFQVLVEICLVFCAFSFNLWILAAIICGETLGYWLMISEPVVNPVIFE